MVSQLIHTLAYAGFAVWIYMSTVFVVSVLIKRNDIADVAWGVGFIVANLTGIISNRNYAFPTLLVFMLILLWGSRLSLHIGRRNLKKSEDFRYKVWRETWGRWFYVRSYFQIYILQGLLLLIIVSPALLISTYSQKGMGVLLTIGVLLWIFGYAFEAISDNQLARFLKNPQNKGLIMQDGLWRYSRHPNYFGEVTQWWAIGIIAAGYSYGFLGLIGPLVITFLILKVSGVPLLEEKYSSNPLYQAYKSRTSMFIPWLPKDKPPL